MKPRILDLFCCAGGAAKGYADAGFDVVGVDLNPQPRYPYAFIQADVMALDQRFLRWFDAIHASPPCQGYSDMKAAPGAKEHPMLVEAVRAMLSASGRPYVIENVEGAPLLNAVTLCGSMFGLGAAGHQLRRHRLFETNWPLGQPACSHTSPVIGVYGGHVRQRGAANGGRKTVDFVGADKPALARECMGIDWMTMTEMSQAIPPAFTYAVGCALAQHLRAA